MMHPTEEGQACVAKKAIFHSLREYDWAYNRPKARKQRGKISLGEWNAAEIKAQALLGQSERGELTGEEIPRFLREL